MRWLFCYGRRGPAFDFAGPPHGVGNGAGATKGVMSGSGRARLFRGCAWGAGYTRFGDAIASRGWIR